jgi:ring-1,2-phenylacetyl-CoA epoxidase subunit PaaC
MNMKNKELYILLADTTLILGQRLSEWCGHGPAIEEDIALSNVALDYIGQATSLYKEISAQSGDDRTEDDWAFLRQSSDYKNILIVELPNGDYAFTIARQFLFSSWYYLYLEKLATSKDDFLAGFAAKSLKEVKYHFQHSRDWVIRMGDGTQESASRISKAINDIWSFTGEMFTLTEEESALVTQGVGVDNTTLLQPWKEIVNQTLQAAQLTFPADTWMQRGGKEGKHSEHFGFLLAEMQYLPRTYPGAKW